jgi:hypothetical protein
MYKYLTLFFSVTLFLCGCKSDSVPGKFIQPHAMTGLLVQIHIIDGSLYNNTQAPDSLYKYGMGKYLDAFRKFHTDSAQFRKSMKYYADEPDKLSTIYDEVDKRIKTMMDSVNQIQTKKRLITQKADSLKTDSVRKATMKLVKPMKPGSKADSLQKIRVKKIMDTKLDSIKKLKHRPKPNAVPVE